jgi:hypothetical protein
MASRARTKLRIDKLGEANMIYRGHIQNGVVVFDGNVSLPDGTAVNIEPIPESQPQDNHADSSFVERLESVVGSIDDLPADFAAQHDHYIHGTQRQ